MFTPFIGCSGYHYVEWKKLFYPEGLPQKNWFRYYSERFNTLELNTTFYRFPQLAFMTNWYEASPAGFAFSVKVPRAITHFKKFKETERMLSDFYGTSGLGLKEKLGCILFQLPAQLTYQKERLEMIIATLDAGFNNVIEFRHESWWNEEVYDRLSTDNISFCSISHPSLPDEVVNSPIIYYRFHGVPKLYKSQYKKEKVAEVVNQVKTIRAQAEKPVFIYFNNTMAMGGIRNARQAQKLLF